LGGQSREASSLGRPCDGSFVWLIGSEGKATAQTRQGSQVAETPKMDAQANKQPVAVQQEEDTPPVALLQPAPHSRLTVTVMSLAALAVMGAAIANSLPKSERLALPEFAQVSLPAFDLSSLPKLDDISWPTVSLPEFTWPSFSWPNFSWPDVSLPNIPSSLSWPDFRRVAAQPAPKVAPPPMPDPVILEAVTEIQVAQRQAATVLAQLNENAAAQQAELKRISRQVTLLSVQMDTLRGAVTLTTSSIQSPAANNPAAAPSHPPAAPANPMFTFSDPMTTPSVPISTVRTRMVRTSRKATAPAPPPLPKPLGPVSIGGAPLGSSPGA